jgi:uncharacterized protein (DUF2147 family)
MSNSFVSTAIVLERPVFDPRNSLMFKRAITCSFFVGCFMACASVWAQATPAGLWQSIDDTTGKPRAEIRITEDNGVFTGRIERSLLPTPVDGNLLCTLCTDDRKNKPLIGLDIIRNIKPSAEAQVWDSGEIMDPDKGKIFKLRLQIQDNGKKLQVRGYIGPFFRNQTWIRIS